MLIGVCGGAPGEAAKFVTWVVGSRVGLAYRDSPRANVFGVF